MKLRRMLLALVAATATMSFGASLASATIDGASNWAAYDAGGNGVGNGPDSYVGGAFDGRYIYFAPSHDGFSYHREVLRYDTVAPARMGGWVMRVSRGTSGKVRGSSGAQ